jgi:cytochrome c oxidase subunit 2
MRPRHTVAVATMLALAASGCSGIQSMLSPRGREAAEIHPLLVTAFLTAVAVLALVTALTALAVWGGARWRARLGREPLVVGGGIVFPIAVLTGLLVYGLVVLQAGAGRSEGVAPTVTVVGKQWWWRVVYAAPDGGEVVSANELRVPVGQPVTVRLESADVIHSFWVPQLGGKLDMIPGRSNVLTIEASAPGPTRGQCAEYCGGAHALMAFYVVALPPAEYAAWLAREAADAAEPQTVEEMAGQTLFLRNGCGACHAVRGTAARGTIGPDLTHVGSRMSLAAAALPNDVHAFARWITDHQHIKPENKMPPFGHFSPDEVRAIAAYLDGLE